MNTEENQEKETKIIIPFHVKHLVMQMNDNGIIRFLDKDGEQLRHLSYTKDFIIWYNYSGLIMSDYFGNVKTFSSNESEYKIRTEIWSKFKDFKMDESDIIKTIYRLDNRFNEIRDSIVLKSLVNDVFKSQIKSDIGPGDEIEYNGQIYTIIDMCMDTNAHVKVRIKNKENGYVSIIGRYGFDEIKIIEHHE